MKPTALILTAVLAAVSLALLSPLAAHGQGKKPRGGATVSIRGMKYGPATVTIKAGEAVTWVNGDDRDHTVVAEDGSFNSGNIGPGRSFTARFAKPGKYAYACALHPRMRGVVIVQ